MTEALSGLEEGLCPWQQGEQITPGFDGQAGLGEAAVDQVGAGIQEAKR
jgi:hypothetical protein